MSFSDTNSLQINRLEKCSRGESVQLFCITFILRKTVKSDPEFDIYSPMSIFQHVPVWFYFLCQCLNISLPLQRGPEECFDTHLLLFKLKMTRAVSYYDSLVNGWFWGTGQRNCMLGFCQCFWELSSERVGRKYTLRRQWRRKRDSHGMCFQQRGRKKLEETPRRCTNCRTWAIEVESWSATG